MLSAPGMILIGSAGRNAGKTEFACRLIRTVAADLPVVGIKITTLSDNEATGCPRGKDGCGVCDGVEEPFSLSEEISAEGDKDTARMKAAGARRVFWLRARRSRLADGIRALMEGVGRNACVVCESNSARTVLEPGMFLVIKSAGCRDIKETCAAVIGKADRILDFDGTGWTLSPENCFFNNGKWRIPEAASAAVLAGGASRRMGEDKSLLPFRGQPMIQHVIRQLCPLVEEIMIGAVDDGRYAFTGLRIVPDLEAGQGPLMGILSCLMSSRHERLYVTACDVPEQPDGHIREMLRRAEEADLVMPVDAQGRHEPLMAVYTKRLIPALRAVMARGGRRMVELLEAPGVRSLCVSLPPGGWYHNINTPDDYRRAVGE